MTTSSDPNQPEGQVCLMSPKEAVKRCLITYQTMTRLAQKGEFPQPIRLSPMRVAFRSDEIEAWIAKKMARAA